MGSWCWSWAPPLAGAILVSGPETVPRSPGAGLTSLTPWSGVEIYVYHRFNVYFLRYFRCCHCRDSDYSVRSWAAGAPAAGALLRGLETYQDIAGLMNSHSDA